MNNFVVSLYVAFQLLLPVQNVMKFRYRIVLDF